MLKLLGKIIVFVIIFGQTICLPDANAYKPIVHSNITLNAALKSVRINPALEAIGLLPSGEEIDQYKLNIVLQLRFFLV